MKTPLGWFHALVLGGLLTSCATMDKTQNRLVQHWNSLGPVPWETFRGAGNDSAAKREFVFEGLAVKDYEYTRYTQGIRRGVSWSGFGAQTAAIGLNTAGSLSSGGTTRLLSGIAGAITGTSAAFSKNVLFDQSITSFISKMDALRLTKLAEIQTRLKSDNINEYSFAEAYRDIEDYGRLGTLDAAFADVAKKAGVEQQVARKKIEELQ